MEEDDEDYDGSATHNGSYDEEEEEDSEWLTLGCQARSIALFPIWCLDAKRGE
jgi:hypothetical protein